MILKQINNSLINGKMQAKIGSKQMSINVYSSLNLQQLTTKLLYMQETLQKRKELLLRREELEYSIKEAEIVLKKTQNAHQRASLLILKQTKQAIDHSLDESEEWSQTEVNHLQAYLFTNLLDSKAAQNWHDFQALIEQKDQMTLLHAHWVEICQHLQAVFKVRQSIKGWGLLNYIFGISPNVRIAKEFLEIQRIILNIQELFQIILQPKSLLDKMALELKQLAKNLEKPWSFKCLDTTFIQHSLCLQRLLLQLKAYVKQMEKEKEIVEKRIEQELQMN
jgi:hypothetical protein